VTHPLITEGGLVSLFDSANVREVARLEKVLSEML
jgi:hypothetical protein